VQKAVNPFGHERACQRQIVGLPSPIRRWMAIVPSPAATQQHDASPPHMPLRTVPRPGPGFEPRPVTPPNPMPLLIEQARVSQALGTI
jgi:hypothetical protein